MLDPPKVRRGPQANGRDFVMYLLTYARNLLACDAGGNLMQMPLVDQDSSQLRKVQLGDEILRQFEVISVDAVSVRFFKDGLFLCAEPQRSELVLNRPVAGPWEKYTIISENDLKNLDYVKSTKDEKSRFAARVAALGATGKPIKIYCGAGDVPRSDFINLDIMMEAPSYYQHNRDDYFIFPFADEEWGLPDNSVDYIFHEDFIEHIDQTSQFQFLAETLRVLKPGSWHRVNTPNINWTMKTRSDFTKGFAGVYTGERPWGHIAIYSPGSLEEAARLVGYRDVVFTTKNHGVSPYAVDDNRPAGDRDEIVGNIYADLRK